MSAQVQNIKQQKLTKKSVECEIERLEYMLKNYKFSTVERRNVENLLKNAKNKLQEYSSLKELKQAR